METNITPRMGLSTGPKQAWDFRSRRGPGAGVGKSHFQDQQRERPLAQSPQIEPHAVTTYGAHGQCTDAKR